MQVRAGTEVGAPDHCRRPRRALQVEVVRGEGSVGTPVGQHRPLAVGLEDDDDDTRRMLAVGDEPTHDAVVLQPAASRLGGAVAPDPAHERDGHPLRGQPGRRVSPRPTRHDAGAAGRVVAVGHRAAGADENVEAHVAHDDDRSPRSAGWVRGRHAGSVAATLDRPGRPESASVPAGVR